MKFFKKFDELEQKTDQKIKELDDHITAEMDKIMSLSTAFERANNVVLLIHELHGQYKEQVEDQKEQTEKLGRLKDEFQAVSFWRFKKRINTAIAFSEQQHKIKQNFRVINFQSQKIDSLALYAEVQQSKAFEAIGCSFLADVPKIKLH